MYGTLKTRKLSYHNNVAEYDANSWGALWRSECHQKKLSIKSDPVSFLVMPESGASLIYFIHSPIHHFGQVTGQCIEGEGWRYWIWTASKERLGWLESLFQLSFPWEEKPFLLRALFPSLSSWQYSEPQTGPSQVSGKHFPMPGPAKGVLLERAVRSVCTPCLWFLASPRSTGPTWLSSKGKQGFLFSQTKGQIQNKTPEAKPGMNYSPSKLIK